MKKYISFVLLFILTVASFAQDSLPHQGRAGVADVADTDPGLFMVMMIILTGFIAALIIGLTVIAIICFILSLLTITGIVSFSVVMGIYNRSLQAGLKWFMLSSFGLIGAAGGMAGYFLFQALRRIPFNISYSLLPAVIAGVGGGLLCGYLLFLLFRKMYNRLKNRLKLLVNQVNDLSE